MFKTICLTLLSLFGFFSIIHADQFKFDIRGDVEEVAKSNSSFANDYQQMSDKSLMWGPYRSALYFGLRPRAPRSLLSGLMWFNVDTYKSINDVRHFYELHDDMQMANWVSFDPRLGGKQIIKDNSCHIDIEIDFVKSDDGQSWGVKVKAIPHKGFEGVKTTFVWYSGLESEPKKMYDKIEETGLIKLDKKKSGGYVGTITLSGISPELGYFELSINDGPKKNKHPEGKIIERALNPSETNHVSLRVPNDNVWKAKDIFLTMVQESIRELSEKYGSLSIFPPEQAFIIRDLHSYEGNLHFIQKVYEGECEFDIVFSSSFTPKDKQITFDNINEKIEEISDTFDARFDSRFSLQQPYNKDRKYELFAKEVLSGLMGGLSYFYGDHLVDRETSFDEESFDTFTLVGSLEGPYELFTLVPSRPHFPRGFYWDEGFHLLPLLDYDSDLALEIIQSWFNLIDENGWIAREQILGPESRSRVPEDFQVQSPHIVNPPTLMLTFTYLLENVDLSNFDDEFEIKDLGSFNNLEFQDLGSVLLNNPALLKNYTKEIYPKLKSHYEAMRSSQQGSVEDFDRGSNNEAYRWRGRTTTHSLASGLDDYPRALPVDTAELNVDLLAWIGVMTKSMKMMANILDYKEDVEVYSKIESDIVQNLNELHWSNEQNTYCDLSVNEDDENIYVCHKGYVSLLPFLTKLIRADDIEKIEHLVNLISDPEELWSNYGVRSLSKSDKLYKTGEDYWRSPIWVQMNYLVLDSLLHYKSVSATYLSKELSEKISNTYSKLRVNVVDNVFDQWEKTGFIWEQYNDENGQAQRAKNFLGWTSTVLLMMKMPENI